MRSIAISLLLCAAAYGQVLAPANGGTGSTAVPSSGQIAIGNGSLYAPKTLAQDATIDSNGNITVVGLKANALPSLTAGYLHWNGSSWDLLAGSGGVSWGAITGTLSSQTDLNTALGGKVDTSTTVNGHALSSNVTVSASDVGLGSVANAAQTLASVVPNTLPTAGQLLVGNAGGTAYAPVTLSQDCTIASTGVITCTKSNNTAFGSAAFVAAPANTAAVSKNYLTGYTASTGAFTVAQPACGDLSDSASGCSATAAANTTATAKNYFTAYNSSTGAFTKAQPVCSDLSDSGTACTAVAPANTTATSHNFFTAYTASSGAFTKAQPACADLSDSAAGCSSAAGLGYTMLFTPLTSFTEASSTTWYIGFASAVSTTSGNVAYQTAPASCTIRAVQYILYVNGTLESSTGSGNSLTMAVQHDGTNDYADTIVNSGLKVNQRFSTVYTGSLSSDSITGGSTTLRCRATTGATIGSTPATAIFASCTIYCL